MTQLKKVLHSYLGNCACAQVTIKVDMPKPLGSYTPRACDCDFCVSRDIAYISDPQGQASVISPAPLDTLKQGSEQAAFLACPICHSVLAASWQIDTGTIASINANLLSERAQLQQPQSVSPKQLAAADKVARWQQIWMPLTVQ